MIGSNMHKGGYLAAILKSDKTVFTSKDIPLLWGEAASPAAWVRMNYYVQKGELIRLRKGIYAKSGGYNKLELATRVFTPAYISFETVLVREGLIFQVYENIFVASYLTREFIVDGQTYTLRKVKDAVLIDPLGIEQWEQISVATKERALLDTLYLNSDYQIDNLMGIDWGKVFEILPIYTNRRMRKAVNRLYLQAREKE